MSLGVEFSLIEIVGYYFQSVKSILKSRLEITELSIILGACLRLLNLIKIKIDLETMYKALTLASIAAAVSGQTTFKNYGGSTSGNRLVDDLHDAFPDPTSPYGHTHTSGTHTDHGHNMKNGWGIGHSHQYLTPVRDYILHEHGDGLQGPGGRYADQMGGRYGLSHRWGQYNGMGHGHNPAGGHGWGDHDDHDIGDGHGNRLTWGRGTHGLGGRRTIDHGYGLVTEGHDGLRSIVSPGGDLYTFSGYGGQYKRPTRETRRDNLSSTYRLPSETDYNRVKKHSYTVRGYTKPSYGGYGGYYGY